MRAFHSFFPELAQREVRCVHIGPSATPDALELPADEYVYIEFYCEEHGCDCRRVVLDGVRKGEPKNVLASISYGWEKESFYRKRISCDADEAARRMVRGELDPDSEQSKFADAFLDLFKRLVLDEPYRLRLRRHYRLFKDELARRAACTAG